jgi:hypothetical protein
MQVDGDVLDRPVIVHQTNCLTVRPHGLSAAVAARFPWADVYGERQAQGRQNLAVPEDRGRPGTIEVRTDGDTTVISLMGQWDYGLPTLKPLGRPTGHTDTAASRIGWFRDGLAEIEALDLPCVAFPHGVGCGLAGGDWELYRVEIEELARRAPSTAVSIVRLTA